MKTRTQDKRFKAQDSQLKAHDLRHKIRYFVRFLFCVFCLVSSLYWVAASEAKIIEEIIVVVNDDVITKTEFEERVNKEKEIRRMLYQYDEAQLAADIEKAKPEILERMIDELLFLQEAVRKGIKVSDIEVQQFMNNLKKNYDSPEAFQAALKAEGYTEYTFKKERKRAVLREKLITQEFGSELTVTDAEVKKFYRANRDKFPGRSDVVKLKYIFVKFQPTEADKEKARLRAEDVLRRCREGADFAEMARKFSDHSPTKESGGDMGYFRPGMAQNDPRLEEAAAKLAVGEISDLIETPAGYDIIKVTDIKEDAIAARRIYIAIWPDPTSEKAAEEKANSILEELKNGADFVKMAVKYSDDPQAEEKAGDWKEIAVDLMTPQLQKSFSSLEEGEISQPVKTPIGIYIFKIEKRQDLTKDEMEELRKFISDKRFAKKLKDYAKKLREKTYIQELAEN